MWKKQPLGSYFSRFLLWLGRFVLFLYAVKKGYVLETPGIIVIDRLYILIKNTMYTSKGYLSMSHGAEPPLIFSDYFTRRLGPSPAIARNYIALTNNFTTQRYGNPSLWELTLQFLKMMRPINCEIFSSTRKYFEEEQNFETTISSAEDMIIEENMNIP